PFLKKGLRRKSGIDTCRVGVLLNEIHISANKRGNRSINRHEGIKQGTIKGKLAPRMEIKVKNLERGTSRVLGDILSQLYVTFSDGRERNRGPDEKPAEAGGVDNKSTSLTKGEVIVINNTPRKARKSKGLRVRQLSFLDTNNVGFFQKVFESTQTKIPTIACGA